MDSDPLERVISQLYDAAADPALWSDALAGVAQVMNGITVSVQVRPCVSEAPSILHQHGADPADRERYLAHYVHLEPARLLLPRMQKGDVVACHDHFDDDFVRHDEYYNDFMIPSGSRYMLGTATRDSAHRALLVGIMHAPGQGPFEASQRTILSQLVLHLRWAVEMNRRLVPLQDSLRIAEQAFDRLAAPTVILDRARRVASMNASAEAVLRSADGLRAQGGRLAVDDPTARAQLQKALDGALDRASGKDRGGAAAIAVPRPSGRRPYGLVVMPLGERSPVAAGGPVVIVRIIDPEIDTALAPGLLRQMFDLTTAEAEIAIAIARGGRLDAIARARGSSLATVRSQLQSVFAKTDTQRQADLVLLLGTLAQMTR